MRQAKQRGRLAREHLLALVHERPGISLTEAGRALGLDPTTVDYHAHRLATEGRLTRARRGRCVELHRPRPQPKETPPC